MRALVIHAPHDLRVEDFFAEVGDLGPEDVLVRMAAGGICGSDLHYYHHGGFGTVRVKQPMALGHEASGHVEAVGSAVKHVAKGDLVAVNPSHPCGTCPSCQRGAFNHCENMIFNGSAMRFPHVQGLFREKISVPQNRVFKIAAPVSAAEAALCEPFSVALHAAKQAGDLKGKRVLVSGCGPIGVLMIVAARLAGASHIAATDITAHSLAVAAKFGCDDCLDVSKGAEVLAPYTENRGQIDVVFECSGAPPAMASALQTLRPQGRIVLVGLGGDAPVPVNMIVAKELEIVGTFRFDLEFARAAELISSRTVDLRPMISASFPMAEAVEAFTQASDRTRATKVVINLS
ncbi:MAG: L-idonate 5-dehydrogenase [Rhizobiales bacterium PAR1]|nr:MAG: L-idonate 5-dehydrogenase [Rhizobiales bacterium PAR1]